MPNYPKVSCEEAVQVAFRINSSPEREVSEIFEDLRRRGRLSATVHQLNGMLEQSTHREAALLALRRMGLAYGG
jgi:hypothetical protein